MVIPTEKTWHYIVGADAHIGPPRAVYGLGNGFVQNQIRRTYGASAGR